MFNSSYFSKTTYPKQLSLLILHYSTFGTKSIPHRCEMSVCNDKQQQNIIFMDDTTAGEATCTSANLLHAVKKDNWG